MKQGNKVRDAKVSIVDIKSLVDDIALTSFRNLKPVAIPTETVYGLAAPVNNERLIRRLFELKERPLSDPLIVHVNSTAMAKRYTRSWSPLAESLAEYFWPGPLTMILPKSSHIPDIVTSGLDTVGIRMPNNKIALGIIDALDTGLAAPSANKFSHVSPTCAEHVEQSFHSNDITIVDGGKCHVGIESTIVSVKRYVEILRPGMITAEQIGRIIGGQYVQQKSVVSREERPLFPGQYSIHYRPTFKLVTALREVDEEEYASIKLQIKSTKLEKRFLNTRPHLAARELYDLLRKPVEEKSDGVLLFVPPALSRSNHFEGIFNRLEKASTLLIR